MRNAAVSGKLAVAPFVDDLPRFSIAPVINDSRLGRAQHLKRLPDQPIAIKSGHQRGDERIAPEECEEPRHTGGQERRSLWSGGPECAQVGLAAGERLLYEGVGGER